MDLHALTAELCKHGLTRRQAEVAIQIGMGASNKEAGDNLFIAEKSVKFHLTNIYKTITPKNRHDLKIYVCAVQDGTLLPAAAATVQPHFSESNLLPLPTQLRNG